MTKRGALAARRAAFAARLQSHYSHNSAEGGTNGVQPTAATSGGASGDPVSVVQVGASSALVWDNSAAAHGSLSFKISGGSAVSTYLSVSYSTALTLVAIRLYLLFAANPVGLTTVCGFYSGSTVRARLGVSATGKLTISTPSAGSAVMTGSIPLTSWFRVDLLANLLTSGGSCTMNRYDSMDSPTVTETGALSGVNLVGTADRVRFGVGTNPAGALPTFNMDDLAWNETGAAIGAAA